MISLGGALLIIVGIPSMVVMLAFLVGFLRMRADRRLFSSGGQEPPEVPLEILVPVKGVFPDQESILASLLKQDYASYGVMFIIEGEQDPANALIDKLCAQFPIARKVISGVSNACGQKNYNLVKGAGELRPETDIIVFCDSTNAAQPCWLRNFTAPLRAGKVEVVTTFRAFVPDPENLSGVCQAIYSSCIPPLAISKPKPWGGATGIRRKTFESLNVAEAWSSTVVDDLVLGNILDRAGVPVLLDPVNLLQSPLRNQTVRGLIAYLDRQVLFPKFTNPWLWAGILIVAISVPASLIVTAANAVLFLSGHADNVVGWLSWGYLGAFLLLVVELRRGYPVRISWKMWMAAVLPTICLICFVLIRSVFLDHIDWHGRRYYTGKGGIVLSVSFESRDT